MKIQLGLTPSDMSKTIQIDVADLGLTVEQWELMSVPERKERLEHYTYSITDNPVWVYDYHTTLI